MPLRLCRTMPLGLRTASCTAYQAKNVGKPSPIFSCYYQWRSCMNFSSIIVSTYHPCFNFRHPSGCMLHTCPPPSPSLPLPLPLWAIDTDKSMYLYNNTLRLFIPISVIIFCSRDIKLERQLTPTRFLGLIFVSFIYLIYWCSAQELQVRNFRVVYEVLSPIP